jgi:hypothetical protein
MTARLSRHWLRVLTALAWCAVGPALTSAGTHHSLSGVYDSSRPVTVEGVVVQFHFVNPHPYLTVSVVDADGSAREWRMEMDNRFELEGIGMSARTLVRGDRIRVTGSRGHREATSLYIRRLDRASDGFWYEQVGSSPRVGRESSSK